MAQRLSELAICFRGQQTFSADYSPLSSCFFGCVADWLEQGIDDPLVAWLVNASDGRKPLDVTLLLLAGLHREILAGKSDLAPLARYYASVGGRLSCVAPDFPLSLRQAISINRHLLTPFIQTATVQTNETGRGLAWLLPLMLSSLDKLHLVDLGASAGLNLVADLRAYRLVDKEFGRTLADLGKGEPVQFVTRSVGGNDQLSGLGDALPQILSRTGCDIAPFHLRTKDDELTLAAFIWGDQPHRLERLREAITGLRLNNQGSVPVHLHAVDLPAALPCFLEQHVPSTPYGPVLIYNTYMTTYLADQGAGLRQHIARWAAGQERSVLWLQWEPAQRGMEPPEFGWCAWTADLWRGADHRHWLLGWVQPHGTDVQWGPGLEAWGAFWQSDRIG